MKIADHIEALGPQTTDYDFLLAASPRREPDRTFEKRMSRIAPVHHLQCPTQIFGYPQGPTAMFWDCMDWIAAHSSSNQGFGFWFESDMIPVKRHWLDSIVEEWNEGETPLLMGCVIPEIYRNRLLKTTPPKWTEEHINGGACYRRDFALQMPEAAKQEVFDLAVYPYCQAIGKVKRSTTITLSSMKRFRSDIAHPDKAVLHGFLQDKDRFVECCSQQTFADQSTVRQPSERAKAWDIAIQKLRIKLGFKNEHIKLNAIFAEMDCPGHFNRAA